MTAADARSTRGISKLRRPDFGGRDVLSAVATLVALLLLSACGNNGKAPTPITPTPPAFAIATLAPTYLLPAATENIPYAFGVQSNVGQTGVTAVPPVTFQLLKGSTLPPGLSFDSNGVFHGIPSQPGFFTFTVEGIDSSSTPLVSRGATFQLTVRPPGATLTQIGQSNLGGQGNNGDVRIHGTFAYVATHGTAGTCPASSTVKIVDLSQPSSPRVVASTAASVAGTSEEAAKVAAIQTPQFSGDLLAVATQPCDTTAKGQTHAGGVTLYDVTTPGSPTPLGSWDAAAAGALFGVHDLAIVPTQNHAYVLAAVPNGQVQSASSTDTSDDLVVLDVTDPRAPVTIGSWGLWKALNITSSSLVLGQDQRVFLDSINLSDDNSSAFLAYWDGGIVILDVTSPTAISDANTAIVRTHVTYPVLAVASAGPPPTPSQPEGNTHEVVPVRGGSGMLVADEVCASQKVPDPNNSSQTVSLNQFTSVVCGTDVDLTMTAGWGFVRSYGLGDITHPSLQQGVTTPQTESDPAPDQGIYTAHNIAWNGNAQMPRGYIAWFSSGVVDVNLASLNAPQILASFVPPAGGTTNGNPAVPLVFGVAAYTNGGNQYVVASDINSGLWVIQESTSPTFLILNTTLPDGTTAVPYVAQLQQANGVTPVRWSLVNSTTLPPGLALDSGTGIISGTPTTTGTTTFTIQATDTAGLGVSVQQQFTITINNKFTVLTTPAPGTATLQEAYSATFVAVNGTGTITWAVTGGNLPPGLQFSAGKLTGTPTTNGSYTFTVTATDSSTTPQMASATFTVLVEPLTIATTTLPNGGVGQAYSQALAMANGTAPFTFALASGSTLPAGLTLSTAGLISGTPTTAGSTTFTVSVSDSLSQSTSRTYTLTVSAFAITTTTLPDGKVNQGYHQSISIVNGFSPVTYQLSTGSTLPAGLTLDTTNGIIQGKPTTAGSTTFSIVATDAKGNTSTQQYTINIAP